MNKFVSLAVRFMFAKGEYYFLGLVIIEIAIFQLALNEWASFAAAIYLSPLGLVFFRILWQYFWGPKLQKALLLRFIEVFGLRPCDSSRNIMIRAARRDIKKFVDERKSIERIRDKLWYGVSEGVFQWEDISWIKAYDELADIMDEVLNR